MILIQFQKIVPFGDDAKICLNFTNLSKNILNIMNSEEGIVDEIGANKIDNGEEKNEDSEVISSNNDIL